MVSTSYCTLMVDGIRANAEIVAFGEKSIELTYASTVPLTEDKTYRLRLDFGKSYAVILAKIEWYTLCDDGRSYLGAEVL